MKIYDISQEIFSCSVYPGDPSPKRKILSAMENGDLYNLTELSMCAHNGTHIDAPFHFIDGGKSVDEIPLEKFVGSCIVCEFDGELSAIDAEKILGFGEKRILLKGNAVVTEAAAEAFAKGGIYLIGNEAQTVGPEIAPIAVHKILLGAEVVLLEGIRLGEVPEGKYMLFAQPLNLAGADGAPCRAILVE